MKVCCGRVNDVDEPKIQSLGNNSELVLTLLMHTCSNQ